MPRPVRISRAMLEGNVFADILACLGTDRCVACDERAEAPALRLCEDCLGVLPPTLVPLSNAPPGLASAWYLGSYSGPIGAMVRAGKYRGDEAVLKILGRACASRLRLAASIDMVVPVPSTLWRRMIRGVNPSDLLALPIARSLGVPMLHPLARVRSTSQVRQRHSGRAANVRGAYAAVQAVAGNVLLVDDVVTTGSTVRACAEALLCAGASAVHLVAVAASPEQVVLES